MRQLQILFDETKHEYTLAGAKVPSVTQIISECLGTQWQAAEWYLERGRAIHACAKFIIDGKKFVHDSRLTGYIEGLRKFIATIKPTETQSELIVVSALYGYAGTVDLPCKINRVRAVVDWKHSIDKIRLPLQLGGYSQALFETTGIEYRVGYGCQIRENGTFSMTDKIDLARPKNEFLALRTVYALWEKCGVLNSQKKESENEF